MVPGKQCSGLGVVRVRAWVGWARVATEKFLVVMHDAQSVGWRAGVAPVALRLLPPRLAQDRGMYCAIGSNTVKGAVAVTQYVCEVLSWAVEWRSARGLRVWRGFMRMG